MMKNAYMMVSAIYFVFIAWMLFLQTSYLSDLIDKTPSNFSLYIADNDNAKGENKDS